MLSSQVLIRLGHSATKSMATVFRPEVLSPSKLNQYINLERESAYSTLHTKRSEKLLIKDSNKGIPENAAAKEFMWL